MVNESVQPEINQLKKAKEVYFYGTCVVDAVNATSGLAAMKLLNNFGIKPKYPAGQSCCSQPAFNAGYRDDAAKVALQQLKIFTDDIPIIVPSSSCAEMFRHHIPTLFNGGEESRLANDVAARTFEWSWFLRNVVDPDLKDKGSRLKVYHHTSCHGRFNREVELDLLRRLEFVELMDIPHASECCGFGGVFSVKHHNISGKMAHNKADEIAESGAQILVSGEASCLMNIKGVLDKKLSGISCYHLPEFILTRIHAN